MKLDKDKQPYQPNFNDPRVRNRSIRAIGFVCGVMSPTKSQSWSSRYIDRYLGKSNNPLSRYLRENLLIVTDEFYRYHSSANKCKEYRLNQRGLKSLRDLMKINNSITYPSVLQVVQSDHSQELATGNFQYEDKSNRLWHPLQRYRRQYKSQILADHGYIHQYDISTCAPTLIHQYSRMIPQIIDYRGQWLQGPMDLHLFALTRYLKNKNKIRKEIAKAIELPQEAVKEIINALFAGAIISNNNHSDIYQIVNADQARIVWLKQDPYIQELVSDIKICWEYIRPVMSVRTKTTKTGQVRRLPITCKQKWSLYFELERSVINSVRDYLEMNSMRYFLEHDGWSSDREIDTEELIKYVNTNTGFDLRFEYEIKQYSNIP
jgi:hypothetical protein